MKKKEIMSVSVSPELRDALDEVAEARGVSRSALVERLLQRAVEEERKYVRLLENPVFQVLGLAMGRIPGVLEFMNGLAGEEHSKEEIEEMRALLEEQVRRAKERGRMRRQGRSRVEVEGRLA